MDFNNFVCMIRSMYPNPAEFKGVTTTQGSYCMQSEGVMIETVLRVDAYPKEENASSETRSIKIRMILVGNTSVFVKVGVDPSSLNSDIEGYTNPSNHGSCWRTDGVRNTLRDIYHSLMEDLSFDKDEYNYIDAHPMWIFTKVQRCTVKYTSDPSDEWFNKKKLIDIEMGEVVMRG